MRRHFEQNISISSSPEIIFEYVDNHKNFSSHMSKSSLMLVGGKMNTKFDENEGKKVGSHIKMRGKVLGINLFLDEVVKEYKPPYRKTWETTDQVKLLIIDNYLMGYEISQNSNKSHFKVFIDYELPSKAFNKLLGYFFADMYAKWCVNQVIQGVKKNFK